MLSCCDENSNVSPEERILYMMTIHILATDQVMGVCILSHVCLDIYIVLTGSKRINLRIFPYHSNHLYKLSQQRLTF